jgi:hypothetical protein
MKTHTKIGLGLLAIVAMAAGCASTRQARGTVAASDFLGPTATLLEPGQKDDSLLVYINPTVKWEKYQNVLIAPVTYWVGEGEKDGMSEEQRKAVTDYFYAQLKEKFSESYTVVESSGPNTLVYSAALINAKATKPVLATISTVVPIGLAINILKTGATGKSSFVGETRGEVKATDSETGLVLGAAADRRVGGMGWKGKFSKTGSVDNASRYWAEKSVYRLCTLQGRADCKKPSNY